MKIIVQILVVRVESRFVHYPVAELALKSGKGVSPCLVIVEIAQYQRITGECRDSLAYVGYRVEDNGVGAVIVSEAFSRKEVYKAFKYIAPGITIIDMSDMLWRITPFEDSVSQFKSMCVA